MGIAIIVQDVDFSSLGMGKVHPLNSGQIIEIANVIVGTTCTPTTTITGAVWSLDSSTYATIDSSTGVITIGSNAFGNTVTVRATDPNNQNNYAEKEVDLFYNSQDSGDFDEYSIVELTIRNGSVGNTGNAYRVGQDTYKGINGFTKVFYSTTRPNTSGYNYYNSMHLSTASNGTTTTNQNSTQICEYGNYNTSKYAIMGRIFPLYVDSTFSEGYSTGPSAGQNPVSYALSFQEQSTSDYSTIGTLRYTDFSSYKVYAILLK